jgi:hypothetical protein
LAGRDEFGRKRDFTQQVWDGVSTLAPISLRSSSERDRYESLAQAFGITARRFNDSDQAFGLADKWKKTNGIQAKGEFIYNPDTDPLRPLKIALSKNDQGEAAAQIKKLVDSKTSTLPKLQAYFNRYASLPFTNNRANDRKFEASLSDSEKQTVAAARQSKKDLRKLFYHSQAQYLAARRGDAINGPSPAPSPSPP